jgi:hypothetical protein
MATLWCTVDFARNAVIPYMQEEISDVEFTPALWKAQGWVRAFISPPISTAADTTAATAAGLPDDASLKLCVALFASYFIMRKRFIGRTPNKSDWVEDLRKDAEALLKEIKDNPQKSLGGEAIGTDAIGDMGLQSDKEGRHIAPSIAGETDNSIDSRTIDDDLDARDVDD